MQSSSFADPFQHSIAKHVVQFELVQVNVTDVAARMWCLYKPWVKHIGQAVRIKIAENILDEMAATHCPIAIDRDHAVTGAADLHQAGMPHVFDGKQRIDISPLRNLLAIIIIADIFVRH